MQDKIIEILNQTIDINDKKYSQEGMELIIEVEGKELTAVVKKIESEGNYKEDFLVYIPNGKQIFRNFAMCNEDGITTHYSGFEKGEKKDLDFFFNNGQEKNQDSKVSRKPN